MRYCATLFSAVFIIAAIASGLTYRFSIPALSDELVYYAETGWTLSVHTAQSRLGILSGGRFSDVTARAASPDFSFDIEVEALLLPQVWIPGRPLIVDRLQLVRSQLTLGVGGPLEPPAQPSVLPSETVTGSVGPDTEEGVVSLPSSMTGGSSWLVFRTPVVELVETTLTVRSPDAQAPMLEATGLVARFTDVGRRAVEQPVYAALSAVGTFRTGQLRAGRIRAAETQGDVRLDTGHIFVTDMTLICDQTPVRLPDLDIDLSASPMSLTTRSNAMRQTRAASGAGRVWEPLSSLVELGEICR